MLVLAPILLPLGLFLPGYFAARLFRLRLWAPSAFVLSRPLLSHFWLGVAGVPIEVRPVAPLPIAATVALAWAQQSSRRVRRRPKRHRGQGNSGSRVLSDSAYLHAAVHDFGIAVAPVWSPERTGK